MRRPLALTAFLASLVLAACDGDAPAHDAGFDAGADAALAADAGGGPIDASLTDAGDAMDASEPTDAGDAMDASEPTDAGETSDGGAADAGEPTDAGDACHGLAFGREAVPLRQVGASELPAPTGGVIPAGTYDAVDALIAGTTMGSFRASWRVTAASPSAGTIEQIQQISLPAPGPVVPRTFSWASAGTNLMRTETCPGADVFTNGYAVSESGGVTRLTLRQGMIAFVFERRP